MHIEVASVYWQGLKVDACGKSKIVKLIQKPHDFAWQRSKNRVIPLLASVPVHGYPVIPVVPAVLETSLQPPCPLAISLVVIWEEDFGGYSGTSAPSDRLSRSSSPLPPCLSLSYVTRPFLSAQSAARHWHRVEMRPEL